MKYKVEDIISWTKEYWEKNGKCKIVIGISGGTDSSVTASLLVKSIGKENVIGVLMPCGEQHDIDVSLELVKYLDIEYHIINIEKPVLELKKLIQDEFKLDPNLVDAYKTNTPARIRMTTLYGVCALVGGRVVNTCNLSEDYVGYSTKFGDAAGDFSLLSMITKTEVREIGRILGLPSVFTEKVPEDGMSGKSDEERLGFTYKVLDRYIREGKIDDLKIKEKIDRMNKNNLHKLLPMPSFGK